MGGDKKCIRWMGQHLGRQAEMGPQTRKWDGPNLVIRSRGEKLGRWDTARIEAKAERRISLKQRRDKLPRIIFRPRRVWRYCAAGINSEEHERESGMKPQMNADERR